MTRQQRVKYPYQRLELRGVLRVILFLIVAVDLSGMVNACNHEMETVLNLGGLYVADSSVRPFTSAATRV